MRIVFSFLLLFFGGLDLPVENPRVRGVGDHKTEPPLPYGEAPGDLGLGDVPAPEPPTFFGEEIKGEVRSLVYVVDASGSMQEGSYNAREAGATKWRQAQEEFARSVNGLSESIAFNVIVFNCGTRMLWSRMRRASGDNKASAIGWMGGQHPTGGTGTAPGVIVAFGQNPDRVVLLADGGANCPWPDTEEHRRAIRVANTRAVPVDVFGLNVIGRDEGARAFLIAVAADSGGNYFDKR